MHAIGSETLTIAVGQTAAVGQEQDVRVLGDIQANPRAGGRMVAAWRCSVDPAAPAPAAGVFQGARFNLFMRFTDDMVRRQAGVAFTVPILSTPPVTTVLPFGNIIEFPPFPLGTVQMSAHSDIAVVGNPMVVLVDWTLYELGPLVRPFVTR